MEWDVQTYEQKDDNYGKLHHSVNKKRFKEIKIYLSQDV
jgi:hypothetical protein